MIFLIKRLAPKSLLACLVLAFPFETVFAGLQDETPIREILSTTLPDFPLNDS